MELPTRTPMKMQPMSVGALPLQFSDTTCAKQGYVCGDSFCDPNPHIQDKIMNKNGCNLDWWAKRWPKSQKIPSFIVKNGQQKPPQNRGGFCWPFLCFFFLDFFVFLSLFLLVSCCFMTSWNPKTAHQMRLQAQKYGPQTAELALF